ncbi:lipase family protein [Jongsikchunia kroppenstedtii]|uniref:lipase family protein n=1 Tax=Jongsikchunia kroppenstedtii TaxID=1121721 RepID=UPI00035CF9C5|nr:lipase family protein [Jongsikchunia kroppenstedtii]
MSATPHPSAGRLIDYRLTTAFLVPGLRLRAEAWKIRYTTTTATGDLTEVSGTVLIPTKQSPRALVGYAVGTQGLATRAAAVSVQLRLGLEYEAAVFAAALRRGWALAIPDYPGLGDDTASVHPYVIGHALGPAVLDCITAARQLPAHELTDLPVAITGYSEGGCAAGWALQLQPSYAPDMPIVAGSAGGVPADLDSCLAHHDKGTFAFLLVYGLIGLDAAYPDLNLRGLLTKRGERIFALFRRTHILAAILLGLVLTSWRTVDGFVTSHPLDDPAVQQRLRENCLGETAPAVPVLVGAVVRDQAIPYPQNAELAQKWVAAGGNVTFRSVRWGEHVVGAPGFFRSAFEHIDRHVGDAARPSDSRSIA